MEGCNQQAAILVIIVNKSHENTKTSAEPRPVHGFCCHMAARVCVTEILAFAQICEVPDDPCVDACAPHNLRGKTENTVFFLLFIFSCVAVNGQCVGTCTAPTQWSTKCSRPEANDKKKQPKNPVFSVFPSILVKGFEQMFLFLNHSCCSSKYNA